MNNLASNLASKQIVGIFGGGGSGKDTVASIFEGQGYIHVSSSDAVRAEIAVRGQKTSRQLQTQVANEMRERHGAEYWIRQSLETIPRNIGRIVVSGLYASGEGLYLQSKLKGVLVGVVNDQPAEMIYERIKSRSDGARDDLSLQEFLEAQDREHNGKDPSETNLNELLKIADYVISNNSDLAQLHDKTMQVISVIEERIW